MIGFFDRLSRPLMRALDPEDAHALAIKALRYMPLPRPAADARELAVRAFGLNFPNPVGIAAGFDKNAQVPDALLRLGFGFVEVGTVTPQPQVGNPRPRLFRLEADEGVINRLGFNNAGAAAVLKRLAARAGEGGIVGVNIGANRDSADRGRRLCAAGRNLRGGRQLFHRQRLLAQYARPARSAAGQGARRSARPRARRARTRAPARRAGTGAGQDRARSHAVRTRRRGRCRAQSAASTA